MLEVTDLTVQTRRGNTIIENASLSLDEGEIAAVFGPSGSGKSTFLNTIAGFIRLRATSKPVAAINWFSGADPHLAASGRVKVAGQDVAKRRPEQRPVGLVLQGGGVYPHMTAFENIAFPLRCRRRKAEQIKDRVQHIADTVNLNRQLLPRKVKSLSGGEAQRVAIGKMLANEAPLGLLDEPFSNLDQIRRLALNRLLRQLVDDRDGSGIEAAVMISHDWREASFADKVMLINAREDEKRSTHVFKVDRASRSLVLISGSDLELDHAERSWLSGIENAMRLPEND